MVSKIDFKYLSSSKTAYSLDNVDTHQYQIVFDGGSSFFFNNLFKNCVDVETRGSSIFYLTDERLLDIKSNDLNKLPDTSELYTPIVFGSRYLTKSPLQTRVYDLHDKVPISFVYVPETWELFTIKLINSKYCTITYSDNIGNFYLIMDGSKGVLQRSTLFSSMFTPSGAQFFKYVLNGSRLTLFKDNADTGLTQQIIMNPITSELSAIDIPTPRAIASYAFSVYNKQVKYNGSDYSANYIKYNTNNNNIDSANSEFGISQNYLIHKNTNNINSHANITSLKNFQTDNGQFIPGNNLSLSSTKLADQVRMRSYTSIFNDINDGVDADLNLNYITYNTSYNINPGVNYFKTDLSLGSYSQININDTTLSKQGCFAAPVPFFADKVYDVNFNTRGPVALLCTWLSGGFGSTEGIWVDRYYYPDKFEGANKSTNSDTLNNDIIAEIDRNILLSNTIDNNNIFDVVSNLAIKPDTTYVYDRVNYPAYNYESINSYNNLRNDNTYHKLINKNKGFVLSFDIINYFSTKQYGIFSTINDIRGGLTVLFNKDTFYISLKLFTSEDRSRVDFEQQRIIESRTLLNIEEYARIPFSNKTRVTISVNSYEGTLHVYLQDKLIINRTFPPAFYNNILYGELVSTEGERVVTINNPFRGSTYNYNYIDDIFLTTSPVNKIILESYIIHKLLSSKKTPDTFNITLPCGFSNSTDQMSKFSSLRGSTQSKSNAFDINIGNLEISDRYKNQLKDIVFDTVSKTIPVNKKINRVNLIT